MCTDRRGIPLGPSWTEPKFRDNYEVVGESDLPDVDALLAEYGKAAQGILAKAREKADAGT